MIDDEYKGNGYAGLSMSNNAVNAYAEGKKPYSKWKKQDIISALRRRKVDDEFIKEASGIILPARLPGQAGGKAEASHPSSQAPLQGGRRQFHHLREPQP